MGIGKKIRSVIAVVVTSAALLVGGISGAMAATVTAPPPPKTTSQLQTPEQIQTAISEAFDGDSNRLALLLESPQVSETQAALKIRIEERGDFSGGHFLASKKAPGGAIAPMSTGRYDYYYCTGYNGATIGWNGKEILACHGWLDTYISGRHVAHYNPDLIPRGGPVSIGCAYAGFGVIVSLMGPIGAIGWAAYGAGVLFAAGGVVISCG
ncbi:hypothetical protein AHiyo8_20380 [Arthrobacter sp. Hiyo8]|uniref:hypothetical protein n=1 Tax=Arthrobacter sp. Hiyo1 TaxID=1588020 RepID=UPI00068388D1|nr:hypothetical protein [Arthrobacter sp. Hiyo1]BAS13735.1 hypothetical protein AHiyo8_20380 [Arthrobacter sp. Hiyo8]GAP58497.1 hypothetical protein AHiyo1_15700 [Arthrobacter sp. Hiyo1]